MRRSLSFAHLSIRSTILLSILGGMLLPAAGLLLWLAWDASAAPAAAARRQTVLALVAAQVLVCTLVIWPVLHARVLAPLRRLMRQASQIARRDPVALLTWRRQDEIGELGRHLGAVHERIEGLFQRLEQQHAEMESLALHDQLTGLPNRSLFGELCRSALLAAQREGQRVALLLIDLDRFKTINDSLGHRAGDTLLVAMARRLVGALRDSDVVCRLGGDEFLVLLRDPGREEDIAATTQRLLRAAEQPLQIEGQNLQVSASVGIALYPDDAQDDETLARHADIAMYQAKSLGRARYSFYHAALNDRLQANLALAQELALAIERDELVLHYQPQLDARTGRLSGLEALIRWHHPRRGLLAPGAFIGVAEECGLIADLGAWTVNAACKQMQRWRVEGRVFGHVALNVSALEFRQHRLVDTFTGAMAHHGIAPRDLEVEITESVLMSDTDTTQEIIERLRALGLALVIDDFGTGYSSLAYLKRLRPAKLKIDRAFVKDIDRDRDDRALTSAIISLARALEITVVAEGVETEAQRTCLLDDGCDVLQGYLLGAPLTVEALEATYLAVDGATRAREAAVSPG